MSNFDPVNASTDREAKSSQCIQPGRYRHYKGGEYRVTGTATHSETEELLVVYRPLYGDQNLWVRPFDMFTETVIVEGQAVPRFEFVGDS